MSNPVKWLGASRRTRGSQDGSTSNSLQRSRGHTPLDTAQDDDFLIVTTERNVSSISLRGFALLVVSFLLFKAVAMVWLGPAEYTAAIQTLESGTVFDQAAALIMGPDAFSQYLALQLHLTLS